MLTKKERTALISLIGIFLGTLLVLTFARTLAGKNSYIYILIASSWFLGLSYWALHSRKEVLKDNWVTFKQKKGKNILIICITIVLLYVVIALTRPFFNQFLSDKKVINYNFPTTSAIGLIFTLASAIMNLVVAFVEEITYRYEGTFLFKRNRAMLIIMLLFSSVLFGFSHYYNFGESFMATGPYICAGLLLGITYLITDNLWVPIIIHLLFNSTDLIGAILLIVLTWTR